MTNAPALVVRHRRFTQVIAVLLACMLTTAAVGISIELHKAQVGVVLMLSPQVLVLLAAYLVKTACDRWAISAACLTVSAEGLTLPGVAVRPIPWTAVKSVRGICRSPAPEHAATPRHYMLFDVEAPESFGAGCRGTVQQLAAPRPPGVPLLALDLSELDTGKDAILEAVRRFHPAAVGDTDSSGSIVPASCANDASIGFPSLQEIRLGASRIRADAAGLVARRGEIWPLAVEEWRRSAPRVRARALELMATAVEVQRITVTSVRQRALSLRDRAAANFARGLETMRTAAVGIRHRVERRQ